MRKKILFFFLVSVSFGGMFYFFGDGLIPILMSSFIIIKTKALLVMGKVYGSSKKKFFLFLKTLTMTKAITLGIKRFFIDNVFSKWLEKNIIRPVKTPVFGYVNIFKKLSMKEKVKRMLMVFLPISIVTGIMFLFGFMEGALLYAELKAFVIGFFKLLWIFGAKVFSFLTSGWFASIIEIFALSWLLSKIEKIPFIGKKIVAFSEYIGKKLRYITINIKIFYRKFFERHLEKHISKKVRNKFKNYGERINTSLSNFKVNNELFLIKSLLNKKMNYFNPLFNKGQIYNTVDEKIEALKFLNKKTNDSLDVRAFYNIDTIWDKKINSVLIFESFASKNNDSGNNTGRILKEHFWLLNLTDEVFVLEIKNKEYFIKPGKIKLMKNDIIEHPFHSKFKLVKIENEEE